MLRVVANVLMAGINEAWLFPSIIDYEQIEGVNPSDIGMFTGVTYTDL